MVGNKCIIPSWKINKKSVTTHFSMTSTITYSSLIISDTDVNALKDSMASEVFWF